MRDVIELDDVVVAGGRLVRSSVSQMSTFNPDAGGCPRKWWYRYVAQLPKEEDTPAIIYGKEGHKELEDFYRSDRTGRVPDRISGVVGLLGTKIVGEYESPLQKLTLAGVPFKGSIDLLHGPYIYDYKFQSKYRKLDFGPQAYGYLEELRLRRPDLMLLSFSYIHVTSTPPFKARFSDESLTLAPHEVAAKWQEYAPLMEDMKGVAGLKENEVWCNTGACYAYGRPCPYASVCNKGVSAVKLEKETTNMSFLNELLAAKQAAPPQPMMTAAEITEIKALPPDAPPPDTIPPDVKEAVESVANEMSSKYSRKKAAKAPATKLKAVRIGLKIGMPEYSSVEASVEVEGTDEEAMAEEAKAALMRRLEALMPAYLEALELKKGKKSAQPTQT